MFLPDITPNSEDRHFPHEPVAVLKMNETELLDLYIERLHKCNTAGNPDRHECRM
jgi:hypothetical protein